MRSWCPRKSFYRFDERGATAAEAPRRIPLRKRKKTARGLVWARARTRTLLSPPRSRFGGCGRRRSGTPARGAALPAAPPVRRASFTPRRKGSRANKRKQRGPARLPQRRDISGTRAPCVRNADGCDPRRRRKRACGDRAFAAPVRRRGAGGKSGASLPPCAPASGRRMCVRVRLQGRKVLCRAS
jgi:hypothetical protein